jgi:hypothetical protein
MEQPGEPDPNAEALPEPEGGMLSEDAQAEAGDEDLPDRQEADEVKEEPDGSDSQ